MPPRQTVERAFEVIHVLEALDGGGPTELAERLDIPKSTAHDYLQTLERTGYVTNRDGTYQVGFRFLGLGERMKHRNRYFHIAKPNIETLAADTEETVNIGIEEDGEWVILHLVRGERSLSEGAYPGLRTPLHTHAAGKVVLANLPEARRNEIIEEGLERVTDDTITDPSTLRANLATIRENGYAVDADQQVLGMGVVAFPVLIDDEVVGSVAIVCPSGRLADSDYREELIRKVRETTESITINYRYGT